MRSPFMSSVVRIGFLGGVHDAGLMGQQQQHLDAAVLGVEILGAQLGIVQRLGADLGAADQVGQLDELGQGKAPRGGAVQEPDDIRLPGAREIVVLLHRPHLRSGEALDRKAPAGLLRPDCPTT